MKTLLLAAILVCSACQANPTAVAVSTSMPAPQSSMDLGNFSLSISVKDLARSRAFYEKLGFTQSGGDPARNYLILKNGSTVIGLFQGMFEGNMLTFNPGWDAAGKETKSFTDIRALQQTLIEQGIQPTTPISAEAAAATGPASCILADPDGNVILIDQHR